MQQQLPTEGFSRLKECNVLKQLRRVMLEILIVWSSSHLCCWTLDLERVNALPNELCDPTQFTASFHTSSSFEKCKLVFLAH